MLSQRILSVLVALSKLGSLVLFMEATFESYAGFA